MNRDFRIMFALIFFGRVTGGAKEVVKRRVVVQTDLNYFEEYCTIL